jgi:glycogen operon protein
MLNAYWDPLTFDVPPRAGHEPWRRCIDTALSAPEDIVPWEKGLALSESTYTVEARSLVLLARPAR